MLNVSYNTDNNVLT